MGKIIKINTEELINGLKEMEELEELITQIQIDCLDGFLEEDPTKYDKYSKEEIVSVLMSHILLGLMEE